MSSYRFKIKQYRSLVLLLTLFFYYEAFGDSYIQINNTKIALTQYLDVNKAIKGLKSDTVYNLKFFNVKEFNTIKLNPFSALNSLEVEFDHIVNVSDYKIANHSLKEILFTKIKFNKLVLNYCESLTTFSLYGCSVNDLLRISKAKSFIRLSIVKCQFNINTSFNIDTREIKEIIFRDNSFMSLPPFILQAHKVIFLDIYTDNTLNKVDYKTLLAIGTLQSIKIKLSDLDKEEVALIKATAKKRGIKLL